jgi:hypothetical protein
MTGFAWQARKRYPRIEGTCVQAASSCSKTIPGRARPQEEKLGGLAAKRQEPVYQLFLVRLPAARSTSKKAVRSCGGTRALFLTCHPGDGVFHRTEGLFGKP